MGQLKNNPSDTVSVFKALADEQRLRIVMALRGREICICHITVLLNQPPTAVNKHVHLLKGASLVVERREGRVRWLSLPGPDAPPYIGEIIHVLHRALADSPRTLLDAVTLAQTLEQDPEALCMKQFWR